MIDLETATKKAMEFFVKNYVVKDKPDFSRLRLEEFASDENDGIYEITLGWDEPRKLSQIESTTLGISEGLSPIPTERHYKTFIINQNNGEVIKMKIWDGYNEQG